MRKPHTHHRTIHKPRLSAFTLIEVLIVTAIILILVAIAAGPSLIKYMARARDSKRKQDLNKLARIMEDYYNDNQRYPTNDAEGRINGITWGSSFSPYLSSLPKDPSSPGREYYYMTDPYAQNFYALFAELEDQQDSDIETVGCKDGCGPDREYSYVVHSPNVIMLAGLPNGEAPPPGGDGGGGGGEPLPTSEVTSTPGPSLPPGPSPTEEPTPTPFFVCPSGYTCCNFGKCFCDNCGGPIKPPGVDCGVFERCLYDGHWYCHGELSCLFGG